MKTSVLILPLSLLMPLAATAQFTGAATVLAYDHIAEDQLQADPETIDMIEADLERIDTAYPDHFAFVARSDFTLHHLIVSFTEAGYQAMADGDPPEAFVDLNEQYEATYTLRERFDDDSAWLVLEFPEPYNIPLLAAEYQALESIEHASPDGYIGDTGDMTWFPESNIFAIRIGWGDCPAGCIHNDYEYYQVDGEMVTMLSKDEFEAELNYGITSELEDHTGEVGGEVTIEVTWNFVPGAYISLGKVGGDPVTPQGAVEREEGSATYVFRDLRKRHAGEYRWRLWHKDTGLEIYSDTFTLTITGEERIFRDAVRMSETSEWWLSWVGMIYLEYYPWVYERANGWTYWMGDDSSAFFWSAEGGWGWTSDRLYTWVYRYSSGQWEHRPKFF